MTEQTRKAIKAYRNKRFSVSYEDSHEQIAHYETDANIDGFNIAVELLTPMIDSTEFYGDEDNWETQVDDVLFMAMREDQGATAREAIAKVKGEG